ncbi:MAG: Gfo/Idh/MocA family oxidoreductase [Hyphomicrobiales bacterium]|nr:Gfo/Idh/MocA family oxidoreductase [Hyphomicrobiales bacterium]MCP5001299.1 Gfo/Idh/MocA family oxidoreductase [Hyphomicrobiales bacterium]
MTEIGIGIIGGGYMGKVHSVAMNSVGAAFETNLRPRCEMICTTTSEGAAEKARLFGFKRSTDDWRELVSDPKVEAIVIASTQDTHLDIALVAFELGKPVMCEKPMGMGLEDARAMAAAAEKTGVVNMAAFNYIRTPASQLARQIIECGEIGELTYFRGEHTEDFFADPQAPATWRSHGRSNGNMGDLAPHIVNAALALAGPIKSLVADIETVHKTRPGENGGTVEVTNDDQSQFLCRFESGVMGLLYISRVATGRKMGYIYEAFGTKGSIRFDQEDQNALWLYKGDQARGREGFTKILTSPEHPDYWAFNKGPGHGTGYQDQIIIEAHDFLKAIEAGKSLWPTFQDGVMVSEVLEAAWLSQEERRWVNVDEV